MLPKINPTQTRAWQQLQSHSQAMRGVKMRDLFASDPLRFQRFSVHFQIEGDGEDEILLDYSKNIVTDETMRLLWNLAREVGLEEAIRAMFRGEFINETEGRAVLHTALRNRADRPILVAGEDVMPDVNRVLNQMEKFTSDLHNGRWRGYTGEPITDIVNIGIGGSDLGPKMVCTALQPYAKHIRVHFVSNVDGSHLVDTLKYLAPERTLFIIASKTFTTAETMLNASSARQWFLRVAPESAIKQHFVAVSTNRAAVAAFGIDPANMFVFWDWVGGRYSLWSAIGLSIACYIGFKRFSELLAGAWALDEHFRHAPFELNLPVILGVLGVWYLNFWDARAIAILPYDQHLRFFPAFLQQMDMESNGKCVDRQGQPVDYLTGPIVFGEPGTNGQHAFFQLLHQGTHLIPADFIAGCEAHHDLVDHQEQLVANYLAQMEALMKGRTEEEVRQELRRQGLPDEEVERLLPFRVFPGNRPSNAIFYRRLTPRTLGALIALYEHKVFVQGVIWNIFSFDQWGVELGKQLARTISDDLRAPETRSSHDASTTGLIQFYRRQPKGKRPR